MNPIAQFFAANKSSWLSNPHIFGTCTARDKTPEESEQLRAHLEAAQHDRTLLDNTHPRVVQFREAAKEHDTVFLWTDAPEDAGIQEIVRSIEQQGFKVRVHYQSEALKDQLNYGQRLLATLNPPIWAVCSVGVTVQKAGMQYALSCSHGNPVGTVWYSDAGKTQVATVAAATLAQDNIDSAIGKLAAGATLCPATYNEMPVSASVQEAEDGQLVSFSGAASGQHINGSVLTLNWSGPISQRMYNDCIQVQVKQPSAYGDSGAGYFINQTSVNYLVGLHVSGNTAAPYYTVVVPIEAQLAALNLDVNCVITQPALKTVDEQC